MMPKIILLRGTSGSGKTTVVQRVIDHLNRRGPPSDFLKLGPSDRPPVKWRQSGTRWAHSRVTVMGRYGEVACGGCDGMSWPGGADDIEMQARAMARDGDQVLMEGLIVASWGVPRYQRINDATGGGLRLVNLTTPLDVCLASVTARRLAAGNEKPLNPENTISKYEGFAKSVDRLRGAGLTVLELDREQALEYCLRELGVYA